MIYICSTYLNGKKFYVVTKHIEITNSLYQFRRSLMFTIFSWMLRISNNNDYKIALYSTSFTWTILYLHCTRLVRVCNADSEWFSVQVMKHLYIYWSFIVIATEKTMFINYSFRFLHFRRYCIFILWHRYMALFPLELVFLFYLSSPLRLNHTCPIIADYFYICVPTLCENS